MNEEQHQEIQGIFSEAQNLTSLENRATSDNGIEVSPISQEPEHYAIGNHAHEYPEKFVLGLPQGLDSERTIQDNGKTYRIDQVDWANGAFWEIKPQTTDANALSEYETQISSYEAAMNRQFPREDGTSWRGILGFYNPAEVRQDMVDRGLLSSSEHSESEQSNRAAMDDFYRSKRSDSHERINDQTESNESRRG